MVISYIPPKLRTLPTIAPSVPIPPAIPQTKLPPIPNTQPTPKPSLGFLDHIDWKALYERGKYVPPNDSTIYNAVTDGLRQSVRAIGDWLLSLFIKGYACSYWVAYVLIIFGIICHLLGFKKGKKLAYGTLLLYTVLCALGKAWGWDVCVGR